MLEALLP